MLGLPVAAATAEPVVVEGHVFNKLTGVPVTFAAVTLEGTGATIGGTYYPLILGSAFSDSNGFYRIELDYEASVESHDNLHAACLTAGGLKRTGRMATRIAIVPGVFQRDLYIEGLTAARVATHCRVELPEPAR
jgi:hypothetical protein